MTDRQRQMIEAYIPTPPDETLGFEEFFVRDNADRVRRVHVVSILPHGDQLTYGVVEVGTGRRVDAGWSSEFIGFERGKLYDNKEDCRNYTHDWFDGWEQLRKIQREDAKKR